MRQRLIFILDMTAVFLSPFAALFIRDGFMLTQAKVEKLIPLAIIATLCAVPVFIAMGTHKIVWRYISLPDLIRTVGAATLAILLALPICFAVDRLDQVARSIPLMQWLCLAAMLIGMRMLARAVDRWRSQRTSAPPGADDVPLGQTEWTLIAGINPLADLYIQAVSQSANSPVRIAGLVAADARFKGRNLFQHKVLGGLDHLGDVLQELDVHGIAVTRIVVAEPLSQFTVQARHELVRAERERVITVASIAELLGLEPIGSGPTGTPHSGIKWNEIATAPLSPRQERYQRIKRLIDAGGAAAAIVLLAPIAAIICFIVIIDVGRPVIFWQQRPGKGGRPFKLYKFRTMRSAHDEGGMRIPDADRVTRTGALLRRLRLDELPQLFNVLGGDMSFVGPRPLLWSDMPFDPRSRLSIRPGITGWAQVNGGRVISNEDKAALDSWYVQHVSPSLDLKILRRTLWLLTSGDVIDGKALRAAYSAIHARPDATGGHSMGPIQPST